MLLLTSLLVTAISFVFFQYWKYHKYVTNFRECLKNFYSPPSVPFFGHILVYRKSKDILQHMTNFSKNCTQNYLVELGPGNFNLTCVEPKILEFVLSSQKTLEKSVQYRFLQKWLGFGLLTSGGTKWKQRRRIITPTFHFQILEQFIEVFESAGKILVKKLEKEVEKKETNIYLFITLCALDIICESAMGTTVDAQNNSDSEYVFSVKDMLRIFTERTFNITKMFDITYIFTSDYHREKRALKILHDYTNTVINRRRLEIEQNAIGEGGDEIFGTKKRLAFLDLLLKAKIDGKPLSHEDIREEVDTFMFEGHDTTASAMCFTIYCLATHQDVQQKVVEELKEIFGNDKTRSVTYNDLQNMKYLEMVIKETLRLYPSVPLIARKLNEDIAYEGTILPKDLIVAVVPYCLHRNPQVWPEPEKFDPERFTKENSSGRSPYAYIPFSAGPRNCIGQKFAMLEMKSTISKILRNFEIHPRAREEKLRVLANGVLKTPNGIFVVLKKRHF